MVGKKKIIIAVFGETDLSHDFFKAFKPEEFAEIQDAIKTKSVPVTFLDENGNPIFFSAFDIDDAYKDGLHIHFVAGNFLRLHKFIIAFFEGLALHLNKKRVTYGYHRRVTKILGEKLGYSLNIFGDFEKVVQ